MIKYKFNRVKEITGQNPYTHYEMKDKPCDLGTGKFTILTPKYEHGL